jgi:hypothetical protein
MNRFQFQLAALLRGAVLLPHSHTRAARQRGGGCRGPGVALQVRRREIRQLQQRPR